MVRQFDSKLILENGSEYLGYSFGSKSEKITEIIFNTSMAGYQEIMSDPSYTYQGVVFTYTVIGNYGMTNEDYEALNPTIDAIIVRDYNDIPSNFRTVNTLEEIMIKYDISGISGLDTRKLMRELRTQGTQKGIITDIDTPKEVAMQKLLAYNIPKDSVERVSCKTKWGIKVENAQFHVVAVDCGIRKSTVNVFNELGCNITVVPYNVTAEEIEKLNPDGIIFSDGPGSPEEVENVVELVKHFKGKCPIIGIGLGHQIIAIAYGGKIDKLKFGHRGCNHPIKNTKTGKINIVSQNHTYVVNEDSIKGSGLEVTYVNVMDNTIEGMSCEKDMVHCLQHESVRKNIFEEFINSMKECKTDA